MAPGGDDSGVKSREPTQQNIVRFFSGTDNGPLPYKKRFEHRICAAVPTHAFRVFPAIHAGTAKANARCSYISVRKHKRVAAPRMLQAYLAVTLISRSNFPPFIQFHRHLAVTAVCMLSSAFDCALVRGRVKIGTVALRTMCVMH